MIYKINENKLYNIYIEYISKFLIAIIYIIINKLYRIYIIMNIIIYHNDYKDNKDEDEEKRTLMMKLKHNKG